MTDADAAVKVDKVGAGAKQHVLAVVDNLAGSRVLIGRGPTAQERTPLKERDAETGIGKGASDRQSRESTADDSNRG